MSWFDEAVARKQREQRVTSQKKQEPVPSNVTEVQQREVEAFNPLLERLLSEYGERVYGKSMFQKRFLIRLERPGKNRDKTWTWHWHLYSLVKTMQSVEVHPHFDATGVIQRFSLISGNKHIETTSADEPSIKEALVSLYMQS
ncbi:MAG TPA: hypothetical protein DHW02_08710 [Ktedonobacter sp.]|nr:hypothetical protein [Ktedonobacter sp.]